MVKYGRFDESSVSMSWQQLLQDIRRLDKVGFYVNEGHRTFERQAELVRLLGLWSPSNRTGAAAPTHTAPHIRTGRFDHAIDVVAFKGARGGAPQAFLDACRRRGVAVSLPVPGEPWHVEANARELFAYAQRRHAQIAAEKKRRRAAAKRRSKAAAAKARRAAALALRTREIARSAKFIAPFEGFSAVPYKPNPAEKFLTIGYGHYGPDVKLGMKWSKARALVQLGVDVTRYYDAVRRAPKKHLNGNQRVAITSSVFNLGPGVLEAGRSLGDALRMGRGVPTALRLYVRGADGTVMPGLVTRREAEAALFRTPMKKGK